MKIHAARRVLPIAGLPWVDPGDRRRQELAKGAAFLSACLGLLSTSAATAASGDTFKSSGRTVADFCQFVAENIRETDEPEYAFVYRMMLFKAAGVDPVHDDKSAVALKMSAWWAKHRKSLTCSVPNSVVRDGNILKVAVDRSSSDFLTDVVRRWRLDVNQVDADGKTVLDFVDEEIATSGVEGRKDTLRRYRNWIIQAGGKRASDLP
jgi:hypothetical protein